jgi:hypothetical protein
MGFNFLFYFYFIEPALKIETQGSIQNQEWDNIAHKKLHMDGPLVALGSL